MRLLIAAFCLALCACAHTAYNKEHTRSWMCVPNEHVQEAPIGGREPLELVEKQP